MKFSFKKILTLAAVSLLASLLTSSQNLTIADCPKLIEKNGTITKDQLVVLTCMEKKRRYI